MFGILIHIQKEMHDDIESGYDIKVPIAILLDFSSNGMVSIKCINIMWEII